MYRPNRDHIWLLEFHAEEILRERLARVKSQHITRKTFGKRLCPHLEPQPKPRAVKDQQKDCRGQCECAHLASACMRHGSGGSPRRLRCTWNLSLSCAGSDPSKIADIEERSAHVSPTCCRSPGGGKEAKSFRGPAEGCQRPSPGSTAGGMHASECTFKHTRQADLLFHSSLRAIMQTQYSDCSELKESGIGQNHTWTPAKSLRTTQAHNRLICRVQ